MSMLNTTQAIIKEITDILTWEQNLLSEGEWTLVEDLQAAKAQKLGLLQSNLNSLSKDEGRSVVSAIQSLQKEASITAGLHKSVLAGLRLAQQKIASLEQEPAKIGTYGRLGNNMYLSEQNYLAEKIV